ncbi:3-oxoadipate enol-lactonase [Tomitella fengzijianii]|uniref:3-oxoadipate enol-lactonase n=1 Tax=Tomitella fengzijianii TaxID=2597660 RepID=A0A516X4R8_9ACTN|nr:3-oxoadipate enol-lactonase [Tomitella fengzijianii]QDQ98057.1 3-oxoadipate enol-lactonase [Tomitella fengzijianii]
MTVALAHRIDGPEDAGAPTLVLIGSLGSDLTMWEPQYTALSGEFRVISADLRGHGGSPVPAGPYTVDALAEDVLGLIAARGGPVHLAGLSLGGAVAQRVAVRAPTRLLSLTLLCTAARFGDPQPWLDRATAVRKDGTGSIAASVVDRWYTPRLAASAPELVARSRTMVSATSDEGYAACCEAISAWDGRADLPRIAVHTLVIAGAQDSATGPDALRAIADAVPGAALEVLDPGAHLANVEQADAVNALITSHVHRSGTGGTR